MLARKCVRHLSFKAQMGAIDVGNGRNTARGEDLADGQGLFGDRLKETYMSQPSQKHGRFDSHSRKQNPIESFVMATDNTKR